MQNEFISTIEAAIQSIADQLEAAAGDAVGRANTALETIREQKTIIAQATADLYEISGLYDAFSEKFSAMSTASSDLSDKLEDTLSDLCSMEVPTRDFETYVGHCEMCGEELHKDDDYVLYADEGYVLCGDCADEEGEDEPFHAISSEITDEDDEYVEPKVAGAPHPVGND